MNEPSTSNAYHPDFCANLMRSYSDALGRPLVDPAEAQALYDAPFPVLAHNTAQDPILTYGNKAAQNLWEMSWETLITLPSRLTAEPGHRDTRAAMFDTMRKQGFIENYAGIRISASGARFEIRNAVIWTVTDESGQRIGEAATFKDYKPL